MAIPSQCGKLIENMPPFLRIFHLSVSVVALRDGLSIKSATIFPILSVVAKKLTRSDVTLRRKPGDGLLKSVIAGSIAFASYWCDMKSSNGASSH